MAITARVNSLLDASVAYVLQAETRGMPAVDNNAFVTRVTGSF